MSDDNRVNISDEAVEAAAKAAYEVDPATYYLDDSVVSWDQLSQSTSGQRRKDKETAKARAALEAAAPVLTSELRADMDGYREMLIEQSKESEVFGQHATGVGIAIRLLDDRK